VAGATTDDGRPTTVTHPPSGRRSSVVEGLAGATTDDGRPTTVTHPPSGRRSSVVESLTGWLL